MSKSESVLAPADFSSLDLFTMVSVKVPAFLPDFAEAWFIQTKAQLELKGVTASFTKFILQPRDCKPGSRSHQVSSL